VRLNVASAQADAENVGNVARLAASLGNVERVDVLPFHQMGRFKWDELKVNYTLKRRSASRNGGD